MPVVMNKHAPGAATGGAGARHHVPATLANLFGSRPRQNRAGPVGGPGAASTSTRPRSSSWALSALSEEQDVRRRAPLEKSNLFNAYFEPFTQDAQEKELVLASGEQYSLDEVIYRSKNGRLLDVQHDMEVGSRARRPRSLEKRKKTSN